MWQFYCKIDAKFLNIWSFFNRTELKFWVYSNESESTDWEALIDKKNMLANSSHNLVIILLYCVEDICSTFHKWGYLINTFLII